MSNNTLFVANYTGQQPETPALRRQPLQVPSAQRARGPARPLRSRADYRSRYGELRTAVGRHGERGCHVTHSVPFVLFTDHTGGIAR